MKKKREIKNTTVFSQRQFFIRADKMLQEQEQKCQLLVGNDENKKSSSSSSKQEKGE